MPSQRRPPPIPSSPPFPRPHSIPTFPQHPHALSPRSATDDFNHGVVLSARALRDNELFQVRIDKMVDKWAGSIEIGVTTHSPAHLQLPSTMTNLRSGASPASPAASRAPYGVFSLCPPLGRPLDGLVLTLWGPPGVRRPFPRGPRGLLCVPMGSLMVSVWVSVQCPVSLWCPCWVSNVPMVSRGVPKWPLVSLWVSSVPVVSLWLPHWVSMSL